MSGVLALGVLLTVFAVDRQDDGTDVQRQALSQAAMTLRPVAPGAPTTRMHSGLVERVFLDRMIQEAPLIFIGSVADVGGSEVVSPSPRPDASPLTRHRIRFESVRVLRGPNVDAIDISLLDVDEAAGVAKEGAEYLVFAEERQLGTLEIPSIVPVGYAQGLFEVTVGTASNEANGTHSLDSLIRRVKQE